MEKIEMSEKGNFLCKQEKKGSKEQIFEFLVSTILMTVGQEKMSQSRQRVGKDTLESEKIKQCIILSIDKRGKDKSRIYLVISRQDNG